MRIHQHFYFWLLAFLLLYTHTAWSQSPLCQNIFKREQQIHPSFLVGGPSHPTHHLTSRDLAQQIHQQHLLDLEQRGELYISDVLRLVREKGLKISSAILVAQDVRLGKYSLVEYLEAHRPYLPLFFLRHKLTGKKFKLLSLPPPQEVHFNSDEFLLSLDPTPVESLNAKSSIRQISEYSSKPQEHFGVLLSHVTNLSLYQQQIQNTETEVLLSAQNLKKLLKQTPTNQREHVFSIHRDELLRSIKNRRETVTALLKQWEKVIESLESLNEYIQTVKNHLIGLKNHFSKPSFEHQSRQQIIEGALENLQTIEQELNSLFTDVSTKLQLTQTIFSEADKLAITLIKLHPEDILHIDFQDPRKAMNILLNSSDL